MQQPDLSEAGHPRILLLKGEEQQIFKTINWWVMRSDFTNPGNVVVAGKAGKNDDPHHGHLDIGHFVCLSYGMQQTPFMYHGCSLDRNGFISMYRWHLPDPIYWEKECRITIQQIGYSSEKRKETGEALYERQDDWSSATFWYEPLPSDKLPEFSDLKARTANLYVENQK